jgi:glycosyltransferase involved in cell wall biosynthesis
VPHPVAPGTPGIRSRLGIPSGVPLVAGVGRLAPEKRYDLFVEAAALVAGVLPSCHFILVGGGRERSRLAAQAATAGLADRFHLPGLVDDMPSVYRDVDVLLHTSATETTSRVVLEAMAHGVAVVAARVGGIPHLVTDGVTGILIDASHADAFAAALVDLLREPSRLATLGHAATSAMLHGHTSTDMALAVAAVYSEILDGTRQHAEDTYSDMGRWRGHEGTKRKIRTRCHRQDRLSAWHRHFRFRAAAAVPSRGTPL